MFSFRYVACAALVCLGTKPVQASTFLAATLVKADYYSSIDGTDGFDDAGPFQLTPALSTVDFGTKNATINYSSQQAVVDAESNAFFRLEAYRFDENDSRFFARLLTTYSLEYRNPSNVLPAFIPDYEVQLKNMYIELDGGTFDKSPFTPIAKTSLDGSAGFEDSSNRDSKATSVRLDYTVTRTEDESIGNLTLPTTTVLHDETTRLYGGYLPTITGGPDFRWETGSTMTGQITPLEIMEDVVFGSPEVGAKATIPDKTFTVSGGWLAPGASAKIDFSMSLMGRINSPEGTIFATFNDPLTPNFRSLGTTSAPLPNFGEPITPVPLPAGAPLLLTGIAGFAWLRRRKAKKA